MLRIFLLLIALLASGFAIADTGQDMYACDGPVESDAWRNWDDWGRRYAREGLVEKRLLEQKDSFALYDLEITFHNLLSMADRCKRRDRLIAFAEDWQRVYLALDTLAPVHDPLPPPSEPRGPLVASRDKAWLCRSGGRCRAVSKGRDVESKLASAQGLGLFAHLAATLASMSPPTNAEADAFIASTAEVGLYTLNRWATAQERDRWREARTIEAATLHDKGTRWFFTDIDLWQLGIHADLAGTLVNRPALLQQARTRHGEYLGAKARLEELLAFFNSRILRTEAPLPDGTNVATADIDHGYWRFYRDNRYAGYAGVAPPATCQKDGHSLEPRLNVQPETVDPVEGLGWDLSHARRLVHVLESLERNREAMRTVYGLDVAALPPRDLSRRFAGQLLSRTWNGDASQPLFKNWLSGANGWYRVAYNDGERCAEGYPPYGLTFAFPTGGYIVWARYYPLYQTLGATLYEAALAQDGPKASFMENHYPALSNMTREPQTTREKAARMMFLPSLVAASARDEH